MRFPQLPHRPPVACGLLVLAGAMVPALVHGQAAGDFVIPAWRGTGSAEFAYWDLFESAPGGGNHLYPNPPALGGGTDLAGNATSLGTDRSMVVQTGTATAFVTSSRAIYSFSEPTAFEIRYLDLPEAGDVSQVVVQVQSGGVRLKAEDVLLVHDAGGEMAEHAAAYKALDDPGTGGFSERRMSAFEWDLTGLGIRDFVIRIGSPGSSMPLWEAQLDVVAGATFVRSLGYILESGSRPILRHGVAGRVEKDLPFSAEYRFHAPDESLGLFAVPEPGFSAVGFLLADGTVIESDSTEIVFGQSDEWIAGIFAPVDFEAWRSGFFFHANAVTGQPADNLDDEVSGPSADPDGDGLDNRSEYAFGGDPYRPDAERCRPSIGVVTFEGRRHLAITYRRWGTPSDVADIAYDLLTSDNLLVWQPVADAVEIDSVLQIDGTRLVTLLLPEAIGEEGTPGRRYLRISTREVGS